MRTMAMYLLILTLGALFFSSTALAAGFVTKYSYYACTTEDELNRITKAIAVPMDEGDFAELTSRGKCIPLENGVPVDVLETSPSGKIRILFPNDKRKMWTVPEAVTEK